MSSDTFDSTTFDITAIDPFDPAFRADPYPVYRRLREEAPIYQSPLEPDVFILTRFADCEAVLRDTRWSSNPVHRPQAKREQATDVRTATSQTDLHVLLFMDPPDHTRLRRLVSKAFTPRRVEALRPRIGEIVDEVLDRAADEGGLDIVADLGYTVPITVICEMMGVPVADRDLFAPWSSAASRLLDGDIGTPFQIATSRQGPFPARIRDVGVVKDLGTHDLDLTSWVASQRFDTVAARCTYRAGREHEDLVAVVGSLTDGTVTNHLVNWLSPMKERRVVVTGERGCLVADTLTADLTFHANASTASEWEGLSQFRGVSEGDMIRYAIAKPEPLAVELAGFRDAVLGRGGEVVTGDDGLHALRVAEAILRSAERNTVEKVR